VKIPQFRLIPYMKVDVLAIGVHPDDVELSCSGTLLHHIDMGKTVGLLDLTRGELGTRGTPEIRAQEARQAAKLLGAKFRITLDIGDGTFQYSPENIQQIIRVLRMAQPDIVLANAINDRHPDHGRAAKLTADACFYAGLRNMPTLDENGTTQMAWRPKAVYHYIQDNYIEPDFVVDISQYMAQKMKIIKAFKSQFYDPKSKEPISPIATKDFLDAVEGKNRTFGRPLGLTYAEGFTVNRTLGVKNLFDLL
jgi:N-acetylglucosamine malate deacetylase 1